MITTEAKYKTCGECGRRELVKDAEYCCDTCRKILDMDERLDATVFFKNNESKHLLFCSWKCAIKKLRTIKSDYFVTLPMLHYDNKTKGTMAKDFFTLFNRRRGQ